MIDGISSDQMFLIFMVSFFISILFISSGVGIVLPQKYNNGYRKYQREKNHYDSKSIFLKNRSQYKKSGIWNYVLLILLIITLLTFLMFIYKEFLI